MAIRSRLSSLARNVFRKERNELDLDEEVRGFVELLAAEKIKSGMSARDARRQAMIETGGTEQVKEQVREVRAGAFFETLLQDLRYGLRQLRRSPGFTAVAVVTLALGIGANTAIFSVVNAVLLRPLPYPDSDRLVVIWQTYREFPKVQVSGPALMDWRDQSRSFDQVGAYRIEGGYNLTGRGVSPLVRPSIPVRQESQSLGWTFSLRPALGVNRTSRE